MLNHSEPLSPPTKPEPSPNPNRNRRPAPPPLNRQPHPQNCTNSLPSSHFQASEPRLSVLESRDLTPQNLGAKKRIRTRKPSPATCHPTPAPPDTERCPPPIPPSEPRNLRSSQRLQCPLIKEYTILNMIYKEYSLIKGYTLKYSRILNMI